MKDSNMEANTQSADAPRTSTAPKPAARRPKWREVTLRLPERTADFMVRINMWEWTGALLVLGCRSNPVVRQLANMANLMRDIVEKGPRSCAKGRADFSEFAKARKELQKQIQTLNNMLNNVAELVKVRPPKTPNRRPSKEI